MKITDFLYRHRHKIITLLFIIAFISVAAVIFYFSSQSSEVSVKISTTVNKTVQSGEFNDARWKWARWSYKIPIRKWAHIGLYLLLGFFSAGSFRRTRFYVIKAALFAGLYGIIDEFHQHFVPGRTMTINDFLYDLLGIVIGISIFWMLSFFLRRIMALVKKVRLKA